MKIPAHLPVALLAACALFSHTASAAPKSKIKQKSQISVSVDLLATEAAPAGASATALFDVKGKNGVQTGKLKLSTTGLSAGIYTISGQQDEQPEQTIATVEVEGAPSETPVEESVTIMLASEIDPLAFASVSISDSEGTVLFSGETSASTTLFQYIANVQVTAPPAEAVEEPTKGKGQVKPKRVRGHVVVKSMTKNDVETKRQFLWVATGGPADTELTVLVNGEEAGTVMSNHKGKVMFSGLPEEISIPSLENVTLVDDDGIAVMQALFQGL